MRAIIACAALALAACGDVVATPDAGGCEGDPGDPTPGDCQTLECQGGEPVSVPDDTDEPADLPCSDRRCAGGDVQTPVAPEGTPCIGQAGICDGDGADGAHCLLPTAWDPTWSLPGVTYADNNLSITQTVDSTVNVRSVIGKSSGKWYWELTTTAGAAANDAGGIGIVETGMINNTIYIGADPSGLAWGYGTCCVQWWFNWAGVTTPSGQPPAESPIAQGIIYMFALDMDTGSFWGGQNGVWYNGGDPASGAAPAATGLTGIIHAGVTFYGISQGVNAFTANFGQQPFAFTPPAGFRHGLY